MVNCTSLEIKICYAYIEGYNCDLCSFMSTFSFKRRIEKTCHYIFGYPETKINESQKVHTVEL